MPPKAKKNETSKKTQDKAKEKIIEDKTFGLKNKKGCKQQKFIKTVADQVKQGNPKTSRVDRLQLDEREKKKDEKRKMQDELNLLFKPVQGITKGVDPKSVLCAFFKQGQCYKGDKCKFSHDLTIERKSEKRSVYGAGEQETDTIDSWDEEKLNDVINKKHGEAEKSKPKTAIICKHFLESVENSKYGWFWDCPNGLKCIYRHALPPGFVLKKDERKEEKEMQISLEDLIEKERAALGHNVTPITLQSFIAWKECKRKERFAALNAEQEKRKNDFVAGKMLGISGRQMFEFNPDLIDGDDDDSDDAEDIACYSDQHIEDGQIYVQDVAADMFIGQATQVDASGTQAPTDRFSHVCDAGEFGQASTFAHIASSNPTSNSKSCSTLLNFSPANGAGADYVTIDEDLFAGDDIEMVDDDLDDLNLKDTHQ